jgi:hypothetical protein
MSIERETVVTAADFRNSAVVAEELLLDVAFVLDDGWPIGPRALYALGSLFEAIALHENVYFDPLGRYGSARASKGSTIEALLTGSEFIRTLVSHGCLKPFPAQAAVEEFCASPENTADHTFDLIDFLTDATWTGHSFADAAPESELNNYRILADLTAHVPEIFYHESLDIKRLNDLGEGAAIYGLPPAESAVALRLGFSNDDWC